MNKKSSNDEEKTWISGISAICALGQSTAQIMKALLKRQENFTKEHRYSELISSPCGEIDVRSFGLEPSLDLDTDKLLIEIASAMLSDLLNKTNVKTRYSQDEIGLFLGTTTMGSFSSIKKFGKDFFISDKPIHLSKTMQQSFLTHSLQKNFGLYGFSETFSTACSSGALAILAAHEALQHGLVKCCIAGGIDVLNLVTLTGFSSLQLLNEEISVPFMKGCSGINLSEGGAFVLLERNSAGDILGSLVGCGLSSDAWHLTQPDPSGKGMERSMRMALSSSHLNPDQIHYINAHGTGTPANDRAESKALRSVFGDKVEFDATKAWHGHTLAGSGALETVISLLLINHRKKETGLSNSFGFGGSNVTLVLESA